MTFLLDGLSLDSALHALKPTFSWRAHLNSAIGRPASGTGAYGVTLVDADSSASEPQTVWSDGLGKLVTVTPAANPREVLGPVGDFTDGLVENRYGQAWTAATLGLTVIAPTPGGALSADSTPPDIVDTGHGNTTLVDTVQAEDVYCYGTCTRTTSPRVFQVLVKNSGGLSPETRVALGDVSTTPTRDTTGTTWYARLPNSDWWSVRRMVASGTGTAYLIMSFAQNTGTWSVACPAAYLRPQFGENVFRPPPPIAAGPTTYQRGQWYAQTDGTEVVLGPTGWLGMSLVLPDRSVSNGHQDFTGAANYDYAGMLSITSGVCRLRVSMSSSLEHPTVWLENNGVTAAFLDFPDDWQDFEAVGLVATWGYSNGAVYANLYLNGKKYDSIASAPTWFPENLAGAQLFIGADGVGGSAADCWISRLAIGRQPLHRSTARQLSELFRLRVRGGVRGTI